MAATHGGRGSLRPLEVWREPRQEHRDKAMPPLAANLQKRHQSGSSLVVRWLVVATAASRTRGVCQEAGGQFGTNWIQRIPGASTGGGPAIHPKCWATAKNAITTTTTIIATRVDCLLMSPGFLFQL